MRKNQDYASMSGAAVNISAEGLNMNSGLAGIMT